MHYKAVHQPVDSRFIVPLEQDHTAIASYQLQGEVLAIDHTEVPEALRGKGYGAKMMEAVLKAIDQEGYKVKPVCPYVKHYMDKHKEWDHLFAS